MIDDVSIAKRLKAGKRSFIPNFIGAIGERMPDFFGVPSDGEGEERYPALIVAKEQQEAQREKKKATHSLEQIIGNAALAKAVGLVQ